MTGNIPILISNTRIEKKNIVYSGIFIIKHVQNISFIPLCDITEIYIGLCDEFQKSRPGSLFSDVKILSFITTNLI